MRQRLVFYLEKAFIFHRNFTNIREISLVFFIKLRVNYFSAIAFPFLALGKFPKAMLA
jgi:hypothetical protein